MKCVVACLVVAACGSSSPSKPRIDAAPEPDAPAPYPAYTGPVPQIAHTGASAHVIASPTVVAVYFSGDTEQTAVDGFLTAFAASPQWSALTEYGVGAATVATSIAVTDTPPGTATETDVDTFLAGKLDGTHVEFGAVDATTLASKIFVLYYPMSTALTLGGTNLCASISAYHRDVMLTSGAIVNYAVIPRCSGGTTDSLTAATSYAVPAVATDPLASGVPTGWYGYDAAHVQWGLYGGEVSSALCDYTMVGGHSAGKIWSNASAAAYHDPCVPARTPYFNSVPIATDLIGAQQGDGLIVPINGTKTIDVQLFSDAPTSGPWTVAVTMNGGTTTLALDTTQGENGTVLHLTGTAGSGASMSFAFVTSKLGGVTNTWLLPLASR